MSVDWIVGAVIGGGVLAWSWRAFRNMNQWFKYRNQLDAIERILREQRETMMLATKLRVATGDVSLLGLTSLHRDALAAVGFEELGDLEHVNGEGRVVGIAKVMVDRHREVIALIDVRHAIEPVATLQLISFAEQGDRYTTSTARSLASPPSSHRQVLKAMPHVDLVAKHRVFARGPLVQFATRDAVIEKLDRSRAAFVAWRDTQSSDALLDADLRAALGDAGYARVGKMFTRRLRGKLPEATLRKS